MNTEQQKIEYKSLQRFELARKDSKNSPLFVWL